MTEIILFIITIAFVIAVTLAEARHDYWVIKFIYPGGKSKWKIWGNLYELAWIVFVSALCAVLFEKWSPVLWILILWMVRWIVHDCAIGYFLTGNIWHIGTTGFDDFIGRIFQRSGLLYFIWKLVILVITTGSYFAIK